MRLAKQSGQHLGQNFAHESSTHEKKHKRNNEHIYFPGYIQDSRRILNNAFTIFLTGCNIHTENHDSNIIKLIL
jgi:hypothetical protein